MLLLLLFFGLSQYWVCFDLSWYWSKRQFLDQNAKSVVKEMDSVHFNAIKIALRKYYPFKSLSVFEKWINSHLTAISNKESYL